jgi:8-amino-7-oxononanoate synthase
MEHKLRQREAEGNLRRLSLAAGGADFFSNDYLGLSSDASLAALTEVRFAQMRKLTGRFAGATGSRLLSGNSAAAMELEAQLAQLFRAEACLLFNSGYQANSALLSTISQKGDLILYDELIHASLREGYRLSLARHQPFLHNNLNDLAHKLKLARHQHSGGEIFVVTESVYSMDGDNCVLAQMLHLCKEYGAQMILDEAHSTGIYGQGGNGLACELGLEQDIFARVYTFGKAIGAHGACVVGSRLLCNYLVNFARSFIYTTAMSTHGLASIAAAFDFIAQNPQRLTQLKTNIALFRRATDSHKTENTVICNDSPIQVLLVPGNEACRQVAANMLAEGLEVKPILSPTVQVGQERVRICLHSFNTAEEIAKLVSLF